MLEKPSAQNIAAFENESTVSDANWVTTENQLKRCFWKKSNRQWRKKKCWLEYKFWQKILHPTKSDISLYKKNKVMQLVEPISYWELGKPSNN